MVPWNALLSLSFAVKIIGAVILYRVCSTSFSVSRLKGEMKEMKKKLEMLNERVYLLENPGGGDGGGGGGGEDGGGGGDGGEDPVVVAELEDPVVVAELEDPVVVAELEDPVVVAELEDPVVVAELEDPVVLQPAAPVPPWALMEEEEEDEFLGLMFLEVPEDEAPPPILED